MDVADLGPRAHLETKRSLCCLAIRGIGDEAVAGGAGRAGPVLLPAGSVVPGEAVATHDRFFRTAVIVTVGTAQDAGSNADLDHVGLVRGGVCA